MAPIIIKEVVIFSSEDSRYPAQHLLKGQKWMTDAKDESGHAVILLQLERASEIHYMDVEHLNCELAKEKWDRIKVHLHQPYQRNKQMTLEFIRLASPRNAINTSIPIQTQTSITPDKKWKESPFARLAKNSASRICSDLDLENKLLRISSTTEHGSDEKSTLRRTAKMVLASRSHSNITKPPSDPCLGTSQTPKSQTQVRRRSLLSLTPNRASGLENTPQKRRVNSPTAVGVNSAKKITNSNHVEFINEHGKIFESKVNVGAQTGAKGDENNPNKYKFTKTSNRNPNNCKMPGKKTEAMERKEGRERMNSGSGCSIFSANSPNNRRNSGIQSNAEKSQHHSECFGNKIEAKASSRISTDREECVDLVTEEDAQQPPLSKSEIKKLKSKIQRFFNSLDMEQIDPDNITLKELRTSFEALHDVTLDRDGRKYFCSVTVSFLQLAAVCKQHKDEGKSKDNPMEAKKRKSSEAADISDVFDLTYEQSSPAKVRKVHSQVTSQNRKMSSHLQKNDLTNIINDDSADCEILADNFTECPICLKKFPQSIITEHAAVCGEDEISETGNYSNNVENHNNDLENYANDLEITSVIGPRVHPRETVLDLSDNMRMTEEEKRYWLNFTKQPKPFHPRMDKSLFKGAQLVKCPTCGQFYKSSEIEEHSDDCAEKVNSGLERRGLYYVKASSNKIHRGRTLNNL